MLSRLFNIGRKPTNTLQDTLTEGFERIVKSVEDEEHARAQAVRFYADQHLDDDERAIFGRVEPARHEYRIYTGEKRETLAALTSEEANALFRALLRLGVDSGLRSELELNEGWRAWENGYSASRATPETKVAMSFESILLNFIHTGFRPDTDTIGPLYSFMAQTPFRLFAHSIKGDYFRFQLLRDLAKLYPGPDSLPEGARPALVAFLDRVLTEANLTEAELIELGRTQKHAKALVLLGGLKPPRMLAHHKGLRAPRAGDFDPQGHRFAALPDFERFEAAAKDLIREMQETNGNPSWCASEEAYAARFGEWSEDTLRFGWWTKTDARPGAAGKAWFDQWTDMPPVDELPNLTKQLRETLTQDLSHLDYLFTTGTIPDVAAFEFEGNDPQGDFLEHLATATVAKPNAKWRKTAKSHVDRIGHDVVARIFARWLSHCHAPKVPDSDHFEQKLMIATRLVFGPPNKDTLAAPERPAPESRIQRCALRVAMRPHAWKWQDCKMDYERIRHSIQYGNEISPINVQVLSGVLWACAEIEGEPPIAQIEQAAKFCFENMRSRKAGNAALWALGQIDQDEAVWHLARLRRAVVKDKAIFKQVDKALEAAGARHGYSLADMKELSEFDWGIGPDGCRREQLGEIEVTLTIRSQKRVTLESRPWGDPSAEPKRGIVKSALTDAEAKAKAKELKQAVEDIKRALPEIRRRFENAIRGQRDWSWQDFNERFIENNLVVWLTRRIIFTFTNASGHQHQGVFRDGAWQDKTGKPLGIDLANSRIAVWHPLMTEEAEAMEWADRLAELGIRQPFAQAWRPSYIVTPPERETGTYSNRFAGHILYRPAASAMLKNRGWLPKNGAFRLELPAFGLIAIFKAEGIGEAEAYDQNEYRFAHNHATTDHLRFFSQQSSEEPLLLTDVPEIAFSEVMRDIELCIGVSSIGRDAFWQDNGGEEIDDADRRAITAAYAATYRKSGSKELMSVRHRFLERRLPSMPFATNMKLHEGFLEVAGSSGNSYQIHLGSAAVSLAGRHICIVPKGDALEDNLIPFEGDTILNEVMSKAFLLLNDTAVQDPGIKAQIFGRS